MNVKIYRTKRRRTGAGEAGRYQYMSYEDMRVHWVNESNIDVLSKEAGRIRDELLHKMFSDHVHAVGIVRIAISVGADDDNN